MDTSLIVEFAALVSALAAMLIAGSAWRLSRRSHAVMATDRIADWFQRVTIVWSEAAFQKFHMNASPGSGKLQYCKRQVSALVDEGRLFFPNFEHPESDHPKGYRASILSHILWHCYDKIDDAEISWREFTDPMCILISVAHSTLPAEYQNSLDNYDALLKERIDRQERQGNL